MKTKSGPKSAKFWQFLGLWGEAVVKSFDFHCKRHVLARIHVQTIMRQNWLKGLALRAALQK